MFHEEKTRVDYMPGLFQLSLREITLEIKVEFWWENLHLVVPKHSCLQFFFFFFWARLRDYGTVSDGENSETICVLPRRDLELAKFGKLLIVLAVLRGGSDPIVLSRH